MDQLSIYLFLFLFCLVIVGFAAGAWYIRNLSRKVMRVLGQGRDEGNAGLHVLNRIARIEAKLEEVEPRLDMVEAISRVAVQKVGFMRFNPFQDTGGDNSFVVVLLDSQNDGFLISSLYTREGVRVYGKNIMKGASKYALSDEEKKILEETIRK